MNKFRFRTNWRGRLILQRQHDHRFWCQYSVAYVSRPYWADARAEDLALYYSVTHEANK